MGGSKRLIVITVSNCLEVVTSTILDELIFKQLKGTVDVSIICKQTPTDFFIANGNYFLLKNSQ